MKKITICLLACLGFLMTEAQDAGKHSRAKIILKDKDMEILHDLGLEVDHGVFMKGEYIINEFSVRELEQVKAAGFEYEIIIDDLGSYYREQNKPENIAIRNRGAADCDLQDSGLTDFAVPEDFNLGTFGGFYTYEEMLAELDEMAAAYPNLLTPRTAISETLTHEGRKIFWLKISDNPTMDETEPEVLYTALHHSREPNSLSQMIFYMWYLLENYETNDEVKYLIDHTEMYFVPCINPDGYVYNVEQYFNGGNFFWRKNRRDNGDGTMGVDLNRNYGYEWGHDNSGSSTNPESETYRGIEPFSEPETQNVRDFCNAHEFQICLNYHTYGNLLIYPWGYSDSPTSESATFFAFGEAMTRENDFLAGTVTETVGYTANGVSDDWMYGETETKPAIYSMTPEVGSGNYGFYPPEDVIIDLCKSVMLQNLTTAHLVLNYGLAEDLTADIYTATTDAFSYNLRKYGLGSGALTVSIAPVSDNIASVGAANVHDLAHLEFAEAEITMELAEGIVAGDEIVFELQIDNGLYTARDTIVKTYGEEFDDAQTVFSDEGNDLSQWSTTDEWGITTNEFYSAPSSITDSPNGAYDNNTNNRLVLAEPIDLSNAEEAKLVFHAKWNIEDYYDYVQVEASASPFGFDPLCGIYTVPGSEEQDFGEPVYEGTQNDWVQEEMDLVDYLGDDLYLRFRLRSDGGLELDGFYFDDLEIQLRTDGMTTTQQLFAEDFILYQRPNPVKDVAVIGWRNNNNPSGYLNIYDATGRLVKDIALDAKFGNELEIDTDDWAAGVYYYKIIMAEGETEARKLVKM